MAKQEQERAQRLRGIREETSRWLEALRGKRVQLRHLSQPAPSEGAGLWRLLFDKSTLGDLENLWAAHVEQATRVRPSPGAAPIDAVAQWMAETFRRHYGADGAPPRLEAELARIEAVLFLRWLEWAEVDKEYLARRYATSRTRVKDLADFAALAASHAGVATSMPRRLAARGVAEERPAAEVPSDGAERPEASSPPLDPFSALRVKIASRYLDYFDKLANNPSGDIIITDTTGLARGFENWVGADAIYRSTLFLNTKCLAAFRRKYGSSGIGFRRTFFVDPGAISAAPIERLCSTLRFHLRYGMQSAVIYKSTRISEEYFADMAVLTDVLAADFGHFESFREEPAGYSGPKAAFCLPGQPGFSQIQERVYWAMSPDNVDMLRIVDPADIDILAADLYAKSRAHQRSTVT